jgi:hypothetical protein
VHRHSITVSWLATVLKIEYLSVAGEVTFFCASSCDSAADSNIIRATNTRSMAVNIFLICFHRSRMVKLAAVQQRTAPQQ